jgi:cytochrome c peroxidase
MIDRRPSSFVFVAALLTACRRDPAPPAPPAAASAALSTTAAASAPSPAAPAALAAPSAAGALVRAAGEEALYVADEDHDAVRRVPLPFDPRSSVAEVKLPGPPAQVLALGGRVLVTVRGISGDAAAPLRAPGLLLVMQPDAERGLVEAARVELPADAWGLAVTPDQRVAIVTSAWTHKVSAVDLTSHKVLWSVDVGRDPRGVVVRPDGASAYVTHLVRASLTRIDDLAGTPRVRTVPFPASPIRTIPARADAATLGYAPVLSPDGARLYLARQALGATGRFTWAGQGTVDILLTADETPLATRPAHWYVMQAPDFLRGWDMGLPRPYGVTGPSPIQEERALAGPRAAVYRRATDTLVVASEGNDSLVEVDALSVDPSLEPLRVYSLRGPRPAGRTIIEGTLCGAPSGVALSADDALAFVFCRSSHEVAAVKLDPLDPSYTFVPSAPERVSLGPDPLPEKAALGRRLFYRANDPEMSDGLACAGCHPEGRDDGHVWHEDVEPTMHAFEVEDEQNARKGRPRQTPMLVSRVAAFGPYGWKSESKTLRHRIVMGFTLHRWSGWNSGATLNERAEAIAEFIRTGLVPPPRDVREPTAEEQRGRAVFQDPNVGCAECHVPASEYTNRGKAGFGEWPVDKKRLDPEPENQDWLFKTPSLRFVGGSPPYFHDGSEATLEDLVEHNGTRMGHTKHLSPADRAALVAFLRTL